MRRGREFGSENILMRRRIEFRGKILLERPLLRAITTETSLTVIKYKTPQLHSR
jgi:hypothetical protein